MNTNKSALEAKRHSDKKLPSEEFALTANSLGAHIETHGGLLLRTLGYLKVNSQHDSHCELAVSY